LLIDHVNALEQCMELMKDKSNKPISIADVIDTELFQRLTKKNVLTFRTACIIFGTTALKTYILPKSLRFLLIPSMILASGFTSAFLIKSFFMCRNKYIESELDQLIKTIDDFSNCIRRNMTYFNEILIMKQHELIE